MGVGVHAYNTNGEQEREIRHALETRTGRTQTKRKNDQTADKRAQRKNRPVPGFVLAFPLSFLLFFGTRS